MTFGRIRSLGDVSRDLEAKPQSGSTEDRGTIGSTQDRVPKHSTVPAG